MIFILFIAYIALLLLGFSFVSDFFISNFLSLKFLFINSTFAMIIFVISYIFRLPFLLSIVITLVYGFIMANTWYVPSLQYLMLRIFLGITDIIINLVFGATAFTGMGINSLLKKLKKILIRIKFYQPKRRLLL